MKNDIAGSKMRVSLNGVIEKRANRHCHHGETEYVDV